MCKASSLTKLRQLSSEITGCRDTNGSNYFLHYLKLISMCTINTTETTTSPSSKRQQHDGHNDGHNDGSCNNDGGSDIGDYYSYFDIGGACGYHVIIVRG
jgi:hypothetical protein